MFNSNSNINAISIVLVVNKDNSATKDNNSQIADNNNSQITEDNYNQESDKEFYEEWGVTGRFSARNDQGTESCYINLPIASGATTGYGMMVVNADKTAILYSGQNKHNSEINSISELFPAYFESVEYDLKAYYGLLAENYKFTLKSNKAVTIDNYDMHTFEGDFEFDYDGQHLKYQFVAYATTLKSNGAYAYWVVYDTSDNQSNGKLIKEHALNMAKTFREE